MRSVPGRIQAQTVIGERYQLVRRIRADAQAETWEAFDARLARPVTLRLLSEEARGNRDAEAQLRHVGRGRVLGATVEAPQPQRILDGGDDAAYGPFVVAEFLAASEATQAFSGLASPTSDISPAAGQPTGVSPAAGQRAEIRPARQPAAVREVAVGGPGRRRVAAYRGQSERRGTGLVALVVAAVAALLFMARACSGPSADPTPVAAATGAAEQRNRPLSGAPAGATAPAQPLTAPTLAAPTRAPAAAATATAIAPPSAPAPTQAPAPATPLPTPERSNSPTQPPTPQPTRPAQAAATSPVDTIRQHYAMIDAKRYAEGYALMDAHLRGLNSPTDYAGWFANKVSITPVTIDLVSQAATQAVVRSVVQTTDRVNGQAITSQVAEQFVLRNEDGAWRIDQVSRL
ncbi:MAG: hypothetical protein ACR2IK_13465 [Chloroflexota bacterium]